jgi:hypothetical protein
MKIRSILTLALGLLTTLPAFGAFTQPLVSLGPTTNLNTLAANGPAFLSSYSSFFDGAGLGSKVPNPYGTGVVTSAQFRVKMHDEFGNAVTNKVFFTNTLFDLEFYQNLDDFTFFWGVFPFFQAPFTTVTNPDVIAYYSPAASTNISFTLLVPTNGTWLVELSQIKPFIWASSRVVCFKTRALDSDYPWVRMEWLTTSVAGASCHSVDSFFTLTEHSGLVPAMNLQIGKYLNSGILLTRNTDKLVLQFAEGQKLGSSVNLQDPLVWETAYGSTHLVDLLDTNNMSGFYSVAPNDDP